MKHNTFVWFFLTLLYSTISFAPPKPLPQKYPKAKLSPAAKLAAKAAQHNATAARQVAAVKGTGTNPFQRLTAPSREKKPLMVGTVDLTKDDTDTKAKSDSPQLSNAQFPPLSAGNNNKDNNPPKPVEDKAANHEYATVAAAQPAPAAPAEAPALPPLGHEHANCGADCEGTNDNNTAEAPAPAVQTADAQPAQATNDEPTPETKVTSNRPVIKGVDWEYDTGSYRITWNTHDQLFIDLARYKKSSPPIDEELRQQEHLSQRLFALSCLAKDVIAKEAPDSIPELQTALASQRRRVHKLGQLVRAAHVRKVDTSLNVLRQVTDICQKDNVLVKKLVALVVLQCQKRLAHNQAICQLMLKKLPETENIKREELNLDTLDLFCDDAEDSDELSEALTDLWSALKINAPEPEAT